MSANKSTGDIFTLLRDAYKENPEDLKAVDSAENEISEAAGVLAAVSLYILVEPNYSIQVGIPQADGVTRNFKISVEEIKA